MRSQSNTADAAVVADVAGKIKQEMRRQRMTQRALARELGWPELKVSRRVNPNVCQFTELTVSELIAIAGVLGVPVTAFLPAGSGTRPPAPRPRPSTNARS